PCILLDGAEIAQDDRYHPERAHPQYDSRRPPRCDPHRQADRMGDQTVVCHDPATRLVAVAAVAKHAWRDVDVLAIDLHAFEVANQVDRDEPRIPGLREAG